MVKNLLLFVFPAEAGIHIIYIALDSRLCGNDNLIVML